MSVKATCWIGAQDSARRVEGELSLWPRRRDHSPGMQNANACSRIECNRWAALCTPTYRWQEQQSPPMPAAACGHRLRTRARQDTLETGQNGRWKCRQVRVQRWVWQSAACWPAGATVSGQSMQILARGSPQAPYRGTQIHHSPIYYMLLEVDGSSVL